MGKNIRLHKRIIVHRRGAEVSKKCLYCEGPAYSLMPYGRTAELLHRIVFVCLCVLLPFGPANAAAVQEDVLFERAYEHYLSYDPENAIKDFDSFLKNFPDSSVKDAALFWKAKSLLSLKRTGEALDILRDIERTFPESPFIPFVKKELFLNKNTSQ